MSKGMRRLFIELLNKQILPNSSTLITSSYPFLSYIVVTPLITGSEKDLSCHSHSGPIRIPPLFPFPPEPFSRNDKEDGTLESYSLSAYCSPKIPLLQLVGHRVLRISRVFRSFPMLQLPYQFDRSEMNWLNIPLGSPIFALMCGIHSRSALGITSSSGWNSLQNPTTSPTLLIAPNRSPYLYRNGMVSCSFIDWLFLSVRTSFSNFGLNWFTRFNGQAIGKNPPVPQ